MYARERAPACAREPVSSRITTWVVLFEIHSPLVPSVRKGQRESARVKAITDRHRDGKRARVCVCFFLAFWRTRAVCLVLASSFACSPARPLSRVCAYTVRRNTRSESAANTRYHKSVAGQIRRFRSHQESFALKLCRELNPMDAFHQHTLSCVRGPILVPLISAISCTVVRLYQCHASVPSVAPLRARALSIVLCLLINGTLFPYQWHCVSCPLKHRHWVYVIACACYVLVCVSVCFRCSVSAGV